MCASRGLGAGGSSDDETSFMIAGLGPGEETGAVRLCFSSNLAKESIIF